MTGKRSRAKEKKAQEIAEDAAEVPYWERRYDSKGAPPIYESPAELWAKACEYFQWVKDNPIMVAETVKHQGKGTIMKVPRLRAMSIAGLQIRLGISRKTWYNYCERDDFIECCEAIKDIIWEQKFTGSAAGELNPVIIGREIGLSEKIEQDTSLTIEITRFSEDENNG